MIREAKLREDAGPMLDAGAAISKCIQEQLEPLSPLEQEAVIKLIFVQFSHLLQRELT